MTARGGGGLTAVLVVEVLARTTMVLLSFPASERWLFSLSKLQSSWDILQRQAHPAWASTLIEQVGVRIKKTVVSSRLCPSDGLTVGRRSL